MRPATRKSGWPWCVAADVSGKLSASLRNSRAVTRSHPRAPKPSPTALARRLLCSLLELPKLPPLKHELGDARTPRHHHRLLAQVDHRDHQLATINRVD